MSASCPTYTQASTDSVFSNSCAIQKNFITPDVTTALKTCCVGGGGVQTTSDGCFTYCNITGFYDTFYWSVCLLDNLPTSESAILFEDVDASGCDEDLFSSNSSATTVPAGNIATTWLGEGQTLTLSSDGSAVETTTIPTGDFFSQYVSGLFGGLDSSTTTTTGGSQTSTPKPTGTAGGKASATTSGPASTSTKPSKASGGLSFSKAGAVVVVGLALFTAWL